jgi:protein TonB
VQFTIGDGGRLATVGIARSSGSAQLDRAALAVIERATPFPPPPDGAQRRFSVQIEGR